MKIHYTIVAVLLLLSVDSSDGQTFSAAIVGGLNASQVNGDLIAGFDKIGLHLGLKVMADLKEKIEGSIELLWSQRGSRSKVRVADPFAIKLNYVEIPLMIGLKDWLKEDYYKVRLEGGLSVARLIDANVETVGGDLDVDTFSETDFSALIGFTFYSNSSLGFSFRYTHSLNPLSSGDQGSAFGRLKGFFLTFRASYVL